MLRCTQAGDNRKHKISLKSARACCFVSYPTIRIGRKFILGMHRTGAPASTSKRASFTGPMQKLNARPLPVADLLSLHFLPALRWPRARETGHGLYIVDAQLCSCLTVCAAYTGHQRTKLVSLKVLSSRLHGAKDAASRRAGHSREGLAKSCTGRLLALLCRPANAAKARTATRLHRVTFRPH